MVKKSNILGQKFGRLTVVSSAGSTPHGKALWTCNCTCGNVIRVTSADLNSGHTKSCGCLRDEVVTKRVTKHKLCNTSLYICWNNMKQRCSNPKATGYKYYGARGITVCSEWQEFEVFSKWALANGWKEGLTIERIDINGAYEPGNCTWITKQAQKYNRSDSHKITYCGKTQTITQWANELGITAPTLRYRIAHWPLDKALTTGPLK